MRCMPQQCGGWRGVGPLAVDDGDVLVFCWAREEKRVLLEIPCGSWCGRHQVSHAGVRTVALSQEQLQQVMDAGDRWRPRSDRWIRWSLANSGELGSHCCRSLRKSWRLRSSGACRPLRVWTCLEGGLSNGP